MEWTAYEKKCPIDDYEDGIHPGFKELDKDNMVVKIPSIFHWIRSTFIDEKDLDEDEYIKSSFFERRKLIFENSLDAWKIENIVGWYFDGKVYKEEKEAIKAIVDFLIIDYNITDFLYIPEEFGIPVSFYFSFLAEILLNCSYLNVKDKSFSLLEIEFYYNSPNHPDPYPHCDKDQKESGNWYFHKTGKNYRSGTFKGLDITLNNINRKGIKIKSYGGILIRSIKDEDNIICGPCLCVNEILKIHNKESIDELVEDENYIKSINSGAPYPDEETGLMILLCDVETYYERNIQKSIRIGLNMNKKDVDKKIQREYCFKPYRYFATDYKLSKGRTHGILGMINEGKTKDEIVEIFGPSNVDKLIENYNEGQHMNIKDFYDKKLEDKDLAFVLGACNE